MRAERARRDFRSFVCRVKPRYVWYRHCEILAGVLQRVADGELSRVMIFMPPRHGKSELASRLFPAYYLYRYPERFVGLCSYGQEMANSLSRAARENFLEAGGQVKADAAQIKHWEALKGGGFWCAGVGGPITGKGFELGIIDDPLKNETEALSETIRERHKEWYAATFSTREHPGGAIVLIQTRWHEEDLAGWLLAEEESLDDPERWHIVNFPALAEARRGEDAFPISTSVEPDWRAEGEPLCPERYPEAKLEKIRARNAYYWSALFQQRPSPREGAFFKREWFRIAEAAFLEGRRLRAWDLAATEDGDYTVGVRMRYAEERGFLIEDVVRGRWTPRARDEVILSTAQMDGPGVSIWLEEEPGSAGKAQSAALIRMLAGFDVHAERMTGDKPTRAAPLAAQLEARNVTLLWGDWNAAFIAECLQFPTGAHDDAVDAAAFALAKLAGKREIQFW